MPLVAVLANLAKVQTDVMNAKNNVCMSLAGGINASDLKFTDVTVAVVPKQSYVLRGDEFEAEIYLAAYNKSSQTKVYMGGEYKGENAPAVFDPAGRAALTSDSEGKCHFKTNTGGMSLGSHGYSGQIAYMKDGKEAYIPFVVPPFFVGEPALVISPVQMNVFYRGLDNPVEISVPGVSQDQVEATCTGCATFAKGTNGQWNVKPGADKIAKISVTATINGEKKAIGVKEFRVKAIPDPIPSFNGKKPTDGTITQGELSVASGIRADMSNFDFNVTPKVKSFVITVGTASGGIKEYTNVGYELSQANKDMLKKVKKGEKIFLEQIKCDMPDGTQRTLANINLKVL
jgi:gliding motility-associated protein GldM